MRSLLLALCLPALLALGCASEPKPDPKPGFEHAQGQDKLKNMRDDAFRLSNLPEHKAPRVEVQHLLISFAGTGTEAVRTKQEAENLASEVYARLLAGEDFDELITRYTDDSPPGIYGMVADKSEARKDGPYWRKGMVGAFGNVAWRLEVGEIGIAAHDEADSPYGWHIIKRLK
jgi:PPIC-type PPIASE domain